MLDPDLVLEIYEELRSYQKVADALEKRGVTNPQTGAAYTRHTVRYALRKAKAYPAHLRKVERERAAQRAKIRKVRDSVRE